MYKRDNIKFKYIKLYLTPFICIRLNIKIDHTNKIEKILNKRGLCGKTIVNHIISNKNTILAGTFILKYLLRDEWFGDEIDIYTLKEDTKSDFMSYFTYLKNEFLFKQMNSESSEYSVKIYNVFKKNRYKTFKLYIMDFNKNHSHDMTNIYEYFNNFLIDILQVSYDGNIINIPKKALKGIIKKRIYIKKEFKTDSSFMINYEKVKNMKNIFKIYFPKKIKFNRYNMYNCKIQLYCTPDGHLAKDQYYQSQDYEYKTELNLINKFYDTRNIFNISSITHYTYITRKLQLFGESEYKGSMEYETY